MYVFFLLFLCMYLFYFIFSFGLILVYFLYVIHFVYVFKSRSGFSYIMSYFRKNAHRELCGMLDAILISSVIYFNNVLALRSTLCIYSSLPPKYAT